MNARHKVWADGIFILRSASALDYVAAAKLALEIAREGQEPTLVRLAKEAVPNLLTAASGQKDKFGAALARRRFEIIHEALHSLIRPAFGRRRSTNEQEPAAQTTTFDVNRLLLGLPVEGPLAAADIHKAYRRMAKKAHPDRGGSKKEFLRLVRAHDALLKTKK